MAPPILTMHEALAVVARSFGLPEIRADANGFAEIVVEEALPVFLRVADEYELEISARLPEFLPPLSTELLVELMRWNGRFLHQRFAVEPDGGAVVIGQRIDISTTDATVLPRMVEDFVITVADWRRHGAQRMVERVKRYGAGAEPSPMPLLRL